MSTTFKELNISNPGTSTTYGGNDTDLINKLFNGTVAGIPQVIVKSQNKFGFGDGIAWIYNQAANKKTTLRGQSNTPATDVDLRLPPITGNDVLPALNLTNVWLQKQQFNAGIVHLEMDEPLSPSATQHIVYVDSVSKHLVRKNSAGVVRDYDVGALLSSTLFPDLTLGLRNAAGTFTATVLNPAVTSNVNIELLYQQYASGVINMRRSDAAGTLGIEFGPNHATGGASFFDWHTKSTDGDYSTRFVRNLGTDATFDFLQTGIGYFNFNTAIEIVRGTINTTINQNYPLLITQTIGTTAASLAFNQAGIALATTITATQATDPFDLLYTGLSSTTSYGLGPVSAKGSAISCASNMNIYASGHTSNEVACFYAQNTAITGAAASQWLTDFNMHGPVGVQPGMLAGINMFVNNYYNGQPVRSDSYCIAAMTRPGGGGGTLAEHTSATSYKLAFGIGIMGYGGTTGSPTRGMEIGLKIGGSGCAWFPAEASKIGTGIKLVDMESIGLDLNDPATSASSPVGIKVTTVTRTWDTFIDLSSGLAPTTAAIKLGARGIIGTTIKLYEVGANTWDILAISSTLSLLRIVPNISSVSDSATRGALRIMNTASGSNPEYMEFKCNGTNPYTFQIFAGGSGTLKQFDWYMGANIIFSFTTTPALSIADTRNIIFGTGTGTQIGTSTSQKLAFYGKTPVVQQAANADTSGATLPALETEVNELKATLRTYGFIAP